MTFFHFARIFSRSSGEDSATGGKSFIHSNGRQASITARELNPFLPGWMRGSSGPLQRGNNGFYGLLNHHCTGAYPLFHVTCPGAASLEKE